MHSIFHWHTFTQKNSSNLFLDLITSQACESLYMTLSLLIESSRYGSRKEDVLLS